MEQPPAYAWVPPPPPKRGLPVPAIVVLALASFVVVAGTVAVAVLAAGSVFETAPKSVPASRAECTPDVTLSAEAPDHVPIGQHVEYAVTPPASGAHWGNFLQGAEIRPFYTTRDRPPVERLVHSLEHGYTILWYDETLAPDDGVLRGIAADAGLKVIAAPWTDADGPPFGDGVHMVLTHWSAGGGSAAPASLVAAEGGAVAVWRHCARLSREVVENFVATYPYTDSLEPEGP
jgi:hypothetical protein